LLALRRDGRLAAVVPLECRLGALRSTTNWHTPEFDVLAEDEGARKELTASLFDRGEAVVRLAFLAAAGGLAAFEEGARRAGHTTVVRTLQRSPYVPIGGAWDEYLGTLERKDAKEIRRLRRRLDEAGEIRFDVDDGSERLETLLDEWLEVEASGWKGRSGTAVASDPKTRDFYRSIAGWSAARGSLRLTFLRLDGRAIACELHVEEHGVLYNLKGGYDESLRKLAPGVISAYEALRYAFERGLSSYEFLGGEEPYKLVWAKGLRDRVLAQAFAPNARGRAARAAEVYGRPLVKRLLRG